MLAYMYVRHSRELPAQLARQRGNDLEAVDDRIGAACQELFRPLASVRPDIERHQGAVRPLPGDRGDERAFTIAVELEKTFIVKTEQKFLALPRDPPDQRGPPVLARKLPDPKPHLAPRQFDRT